MSQRTVEVVATSQADNAAYMALADVASTVADLPDARIVGGHMVSLLGLAFPISGQTVRRTVDADAAIAPAVASSGNLHSSLIGIGYAPESGNRYVLDDRAIDLLVPSPDHRPRTKQYGGRAFDAFPGLSLALAAEPFALRVSVTLTDERHLDFLVRVPPVEYALILKAYALNGRFAPKDVADAYTLLGIASEYPQEDIGGWRLDESRLIGTRLDAARALHAITDQATRSTAVRDAEVPVHRLVALVRRYVTHP